MNTNRDANGRRTTGMTDQQREQIRREAEEACPHKATYGLIDKMTRGTWIAGYIAHVEKLEEKEDKTDD